MSKSRNDRGKTPSAAQNVPPVVQNAIIPGRLMEDDWNDWVENETGEEFVDEIVRELADHVCNKVLEKVIKSRVRPYAVLKAKQLLMDMIVWRFVNTDDGEMDTSEQTSWTEDEEPTPCVTDSWAQGAVPVITERTLTPLIEDTPQHINYIQSNTDTSLEINDQRDQSPADLHKTTRTTDFNDGNDVDDDAELMVPDQQQDVEETKELVSPTPCVSEAVLTCCHAEPTLAPQPPIQSKMKENSFRNPKKFRAYKGSVPKFQPISLTPVTEDRPKPLKKENRTSSILHSSESLLRIQNGRPPGIKQVQYNEKGNVIHVQKLNPDDLPNHRILTKYEVVDVNADPSSNKRISRHKVIKGNVKGNRLKAISNTGALLRKFDVTEGAVTPLPPPMVDSMDVSVGVVIREGGLFKSGPRNPPIEEKTDKPLLPVSSSTNRILKAKEIIADSSPFIKSLYFTKTSASIS